MLLAIDTSTSQIGLALYDGNQVNAELTWVTSTRHTQELAPAVTYLLSRCKKSMSDINALGVATGPGSFTSLRVGLAFSKGIALARGIPVVGVPTLEVVAASTPPSDRKLGAILQAGRGKLAIVWFENGENGWVAQGPPIVMSAEELEQSIHKPVFLCGEMTAEDRHHLARRFKNVQLASPAECIRRPGVLAEIAWKRWQAHNVDQVSSLAPIYLHTISGPPQ